MTLLLFLLLSSVVNAQQTPIPSVPESIFDIPKIDCGLNTRVSGHMIADGCLQEATNVTFDLDGSVARRQGYGFCNSVALSTPAAIRRLYEFDASDGTKYIVAISSDKIWKAGPDCSFSVIPGMTGLSPILNTSCTQVMGKLWCVNQADGLIYWDGASTGTVPSAPRGTLIGNFRNRILMGNVSGAVSQLYGSGYLDGTNWVTSNKSTSPFILPLSGSNDGRQVSCLLGTHGDAFMLGQPDRIYGLYGFSNNDFAIREFSRETGCIDNQSAQEYDGSLIWLSKRGIERMRGPSIDWRVSDPVINIINPIILAGGNSRNAVDTTQGDFQAGNLTVSGARAPMSATISPGNVVPSSWTGVDATSAAFDQGTKSILVYDNSFRMVLSSNVYEDRWSNGLTSGRLAWSVTNGSFGIETTIGPNAITANKATFAGSAIETSSVTMSSGSWRWYYQYGNSASATSCADSGQTNICFQVRFMANASGDFYSLTYYSGDSLRLIKYVSGVETILNSYSETLLRGTQYVFEVQRSTAGDMYVLQDGVYVATASADNSVTGITKMQIVDNGCQGCRSVPGLNFNNYFYNIYNYQYRDRGSFVSRIFDTSFSTPIWGNFSGVFSAPAYEADVFFYTQTSTAADGGGFDSLVATSDTLRIASSAKRYIRYKADLFTYVSTKTPSLSGVGLLAETTGYFISQCHSIGSNITSWGVFTCNTVPNNGSLSFSLSTGTSCGAVTSPSANWINQSNNSIIGVATTTTIAFRTLFSLDSATQVPALQDCTINWNEGTSRPDSASLVYNHSYHLFYTTSTGSSVINSNALVLDQLDRWSLWDDIPASAVVLYNLNPMAGDGNSTGYVYRMYSGNDDAGRSFTSRVRTKDFDLGNWRQKKEYGPLFLEVLPPTDLVSNVPLTISGYIDLTKTVPLGSVNTTEDTGLLAARVPWPIENQSVSSYISIGVSNSGNQPWKLYRGALRYRPVREP